MTEVVQQRTAEQERKLIAAGDMTLELSVVKVRYWHPYRGAVFEGRDEQDNSTVVGATATGGVITRMPNEGEAWRVKGRYFMHPKHGLQFRAKECMLIKPNHGKLIIHWIVKHIRGIGEKKANEIFTYFDQRGERLDEILDAGRLDRLKEIMSDRTGVPERLLETWHERKLETTVISELDRLGFRTHLAITLLRIWGVHAIDMVRANPYFMVAFAGWATVDRIARKMGIPLDDPRRKIGAVEAAMILRLKDKHTLTSHAGLRRRVQALLGPGFGPAAANQAINLARQVASAVPTLDGRGYQTRPVAAMEGYLMDRIPRMVAGERDVQAAMLDAYGRPKGDGWASLLDTCGVVNDAGALRIEEAIQRFQAKTGKLLNVEQGNAVIMAAEKPFFTLLGEAGTGKTCAIGAIHELAEGLGAKVYQMALSGRAKEKLRKDTKRPALTIAKFIRMVGDGDIVLSDGDLLIIDEASMLGLSTLFFIISAMPKGARLILVGDPGQLPPIEFGLTFHVLAEEDSGVPQVKLKEIWRQRAATGIPKVAKAVRLAHLKPKYAAMIRSILDESDTNPLIGRYQGRKDGVSFVDCPKDKIADKMLEISQQLGGCDNVQIVGVVKGGKAGTVHTNLEFHKHLSKGKPRMPLENYAVGDPVIWLQNDSERDLYNGTLGKVIGVNYSVGSEPTLICDFDGDRQEIPAGELYKMGLAYAVTCHKFQGSSAPIVIIPVVKSRLLDAILLYTALTRAECQVVLVGDRALFVEAVLRPPHSLMRDIGMSVRALRERIVRADARKAA